MSFKQDALRALHDDPVGRLRREAEEKRSKGPRVQAMLRHREEDRALGQDHRRESMALQSKHISRRAAEYAVDGPRPPRFEEKMQAENSALNARHGRERAALRERHEREMKTIKD
jgi:hypothetical protein